MIRWERWQRHGPVLLSTERVPAEGGGGFAIRFVEVEAAESVPPGTFQPPTGD
jgi:hypothetical protein